MTDSHMAAKNIVSKYTLYAAGAGLVPIPMLDLAALTAVTVSGTSCKDSSRLRAVTTISSRASEFSLLAPVACAAACGPVRMVATAAATAVSGVRLNDPFMSRPSDENWCFCLN
jgi:flagellar biosynthesis component FlhA